jgi:hypothetical protein
MVQQVHDTPTLVELLMYGSRGSGTPDWYRKLVQSDISFKLTIKTSLAYPLIEPSALLDSYSIHPTTYAAVLFLRKRPRVKCATGPDWSLVPRI